MVAQHDKNLHEKLKPDMLVLMEIPGKHPCKLDLPKDGPWEVVEQRVKDERVLPVYKLMNEDNNVILSHKESFSF